MILTLLLFAESLFYLHTTVEKMATGQVHMTGAYAGWTLDQFCIELARRLYDPTETFWPRAEKRLYVYEALRMWNSLTCFWRGDFTFNGRNGVTWYDLTDTANLPNTLRPLT